MEWSSYEFREVHKGQMEIKEKIAEMELEIKKQRRRIAVLECALNKQACCWRHGWGHPIDQENKDFVWSHLFEGDGPLEEAYEKI